MNVNYVTLEEIKQLLAYNKNSKQSVIFKVADLCGSWYTDKLLNEFIITNDFKIARLLYIRFQMEYEYCSNKFYKVLYEILYKYFSKLSSILMFGKYHTNYYDWLINCNNKTYYELCDYLLESDIINHGIPKLSSKINVTEDGMVIDINWKVGS